MAKSRGNSFGRRGFLKGAAAGAAAIVAQPQISKAQESEASRANSAATRGPGGAQLARDAGAPVEAARG
jgi:hypothetical protein